MKIVSIYRTDPKNFENGPAPDMHEKMGKLIEKFIASGELVDTGGVVPAGMLKRVRLNANGSFSQTDGPFTETKELVGGYALFDVVSHERAIELTKEFLSVTGHGECELIEVTSVADEAVHR